MAAVAFCIVTVMLMEIRLSRGKYAKPLGAEEACPPATGKAPSLNMTTRDAGLYSACL